MHHGNLTVKIIQARNFKRKETSKKIHVQGSLIYRSFKSDFMGLVGEQSDGPTQFQQCPLEVGHPIDSRCGPTSAAGVLGVVR